MRQFHILRSYGTFTRKNQSGSALFWMLVLVGVPFVVGLYCICILLPFKLNDQLFPFFIEMRTHGSSFNFCENKEFIGAETLINTGFLPQTLTRQSASLTSPAYFKFAYYKTPMTVKCTNNALGKQQIILSLDDIGDNSTLCMEMAELSRVANFDFQVQNTTTISAINSKMDKSTVNNNCKSTAAHHLRIRLIP